MPSSGIIPVYFGASDKLIFGCLHRSQSIERRRCGVVVCPPVGHEYVNCHRALRQLATLVAKAGFPVLRFDYYGCGDSSGQETEGSLSQWLKDTSAAISELRRRENVARVCLVGVRLGGAISLLAGVERDELAGLVLWDAVINGDEFLREVLVLQKKMMHFRPKPRKSKEVPGNALDLFGFGMSETLRGEVEGIDLLGVSRRPAEKVMIIESDRGTGGETLCQHLERMEAQVDYEHSDGPRFWETNPEGTLLVPSQVLRSIVSWIMNKHL
jgi:uncharacterized protein